MVRKPTRQSRCLPKCGPGHPIGVQLTAILELHVIEVAVDVGYLRRNGIVLILDRPCGGTDGLNTDYFGAPSVGTTTSTSKLSDSVAVAVGGFIGDGSPDFVGPKSVSASR